jgi:hypothetical protein
MARGPVWIEAYEQYLLRKNVCEKSKLERLSDDALAEKYFGSLRNVGVVKSICKQKQTAAYQCSNHGISATGGFTSHGYSCRNRVSFVN